MADEKKPDPKPEQAPKKKWWQAALAGLGKAAGEWMFGGNR
jgi:hypothetical protein